MRKLLPLIVLFLSIISCKTYVQLYKTSSSLNKDELGNYTFENDTLKITYSLWKEKGIMAFSIYNKLSKPIYVDWKKCSFIDNSVKLNYWSEEIINENRLYLYNGPLIKADLNTSSIESSVGISYQKERITFIPPNSVTYRSDFYLIPMSKVSWGQYKYKQTIEPRNDGSGKSTTLYTTEFSRNNSPIVFRNFLTLSLSENFESEFYIDSEFFVSEMWEMERKHFESIQTDKEGKIFELFHFYLQDRFYMRYQSRPS